MARILVVDDEKSIRTTLKEFIEEDGHEVLTATDAEEALDLLEEDPVDVVVTDIILPRVTGVTLLDRIHEIEPDVQVVMITGEPNVDTAAAAVRAGAFDYLSKPISQEEIRAVIASAVRVKSLADRRAELEEEKRRYQENLEEEVAAKTEALRESEEKYRTVIENANEAVFVAQGEMLRFINPKTETVTGYSAAELLSKPFVELIYPEDRDLVLERYAERLKGEEVPEGYDFRIVTAEGTTRWIEIRPVLIEWEGSPATLNFASDITDRIAAERALEESENLYRILFEGSPVSLWLEDFSGVKRRLDRLREDGVENITAHLEAHPEVVDECIGLVRIEDMNAASLELHDAESKEQLLGDLSKVLTPESKAAFIEELAQVAAGARRFETTTIDQTLKGERKHISLRWIPAPGSEEKLDRILISKIDVSAEAEAEAALHAALQGTIEAIGRTTETRDPYTAGHQRRVTELAVAIAEEMGLDRVRIEGTRAAGLMHDIGKMAVPAEILSKPSALTDMEMALIQSHPRVAYDILESVAFPWPLAQIVLQHHERLDGSGYPLGLPGDETRVEARILAVADTVEAMASHRPYRAALGIDVALAEIETGKGSRYDPEAVDACLRLFREERFAFDVTDPREA